MNTVQILKKRELNWQEWLKNGDQYLKAATPRGEKSVFGLELRYNLLSMSLEAYVMAMTDYHHNLPDNHTYTDLIMGLERVVPMDQILKNRLLKYENIQSICSLEKYHRTTPTEDELDDLKGAIDRISVMAHGNCLPETSKLGPS